MAGVMKFGISTFVTDEGIRPTTLATALEERGFDSLFLAEHSHIPVSRETPYPDGGELPRPYYRTLDPFVALSAAAAVTETLLLGTGVALVVQRDVIHTANEAASLDLISDGRFVFGVGVGWNREEMRNHGTDPRTRGALLNEQLQAIKAIWTSEQAEFHGEHVDFDPIYAWPKPVRTPHPPIYVGGESPAAIERLAAHGDGWLPRGHTEPEQIRSVLRSLAERGKSDVPVTIFAAGRDESRIEGWADVGVERVTFFLPTLPEAETLTALDELAALAGRHAG
ncbi:flavin-dependent oxidoreductase, F420-dependent methylene-tetrahydromethanopterin reductase [Saccharomonospora azurea SZMC 14600]|nr:flavin-dependent oxidoreductase, F420-dependent methylene-tetrahydromethanopterin reductase [Saccharomonospora azurea SZMC 14600]